MAKAAVVITCFNEAKTGWRERATPEGPLTWQHEDALSEKYDDNELLATIESVRNSTTNNVPIVVVDDGSTDGCTDGIEKDGVTVVRHKDRIGIGFSRREGVEAMPSDCDSVMFLDAHQRLSPGCLEHCSGLAMEHNAVVWPDTRGLRDRLRYEGKPPGGKNITWSGHGARPSTWNDTKTEQGLFAYAWINDPPLDKLSRTHALISPGYVMPVSVRDRVKCSRLARGFGGNEPVVWVGAYFLDIPILHTCDAMVRHQFRATAGHYAVTAKEVHRNMAITAKRWFSDESWRNYWWPQVFAKREMDDDALAALDSHEMSEDHVAAQSQKKRSDAEFFFGFCREPVPEGITWKYRS